MTDAQFRRFDFGVRTDRTIAAASLLMIAALVTACQRTVSDELPAQAADVQAASAAAALPSSDTILGWIAEIEKQGIRRPGYPANAWVENWTRDRFVEFGLQEVRLEPIEVAYWAPQSWSLKVWPTDDQAAAVEIPAWPIPLSAGTEALEGELVLAASEGAVSGKIAVVELGLLSSTQTRMRDQVATWAYDPDGEFDTLTQVWPLGPRFQKVMDPEIEAGAAGFIGILDFPWETAQYYVPYDAKARAIPGLYLSRADGRRLKGMLAQGSVVGRIELARELSTRASHNVIGVLPGASDDWVIVGSHHDGPWHSAVEDASGVALVMAQAQYWAQVPRAARPHNMMFLLTGGHMSLAAGTRAFAATYKELLEERVVAEIHLEHTAREATVVDGKLVPTDKPEVRWWFTSHIPRLEEIVAQAICRQDLERSLLMPMEGFPRPDSKHPPTDAAFLHPLTPIVSFLTAPMYLFDPADRLEMIHVPSLVPVSRAVIDIVEGLRGLSASEIRKGIYTPPRKAPPLPTCGRSRAKASAVGVDM